MKLIIINETFKIHIIMLWNKYSIRTYTQEMQENYYITFEKINNKLRKQGKVAVFKLRFNFFKLMLKFYWSSEENCSFIKNIFSLITDFIELSFLSLLHLWLVSYKHQLLYPYFLNSKPKESIKMWKSCYIWTNSQFKIIRYMGRKTTLFI